MSGNRWFRTTIVAASAALLLALPVHAAGAAAVPTPAPPSTSAAPNAPVMASDTAECAQPANQRDGAWVCADSDSTTPAKSAGARPSAVAAFLSSYCETGHGCWYTDTSTQSEFLLSDFAYGVTINGKSTTVGHVSGDLVWATSGGLPGNTALAHGDLTFYTASATHLLLTGQLLNAAKGAIGSVIRNCTAVSLGTGAASTRINFPTNACLEGGTHNIDHTMSTSFSWSVAQFPSVQWIIGVKSVVAHSLNPSAGVYRFQIASNLAADHFYYLAVD